ncbi:hypothetical protein J6590_018277 [Homalodisca vitripennis]|nr:hypothetical protein J6590_018277 [Homalodisca vitripennis]
MAVTRCEMMEMLEQRYDEVTVKDSVKQSGGWAPRVKRIAPWCSELLDSIKRPDIFVAVGDNKSLTCGIMKDNRRNVGSGMTYYLKWPPKPKS